MVQPERPQIILRLRVEHWISTVTRAQLHARAHALIHTCGRAHAHARPHLRAHTHKHKQVIIIAFPMQQSLRERASMLRYTYIACIVGFSNGVWMR